MLKPGPPPAPTTRFQVPSPDKATSSEYPTISPAGRRLAFIATVESKTLLWVRPLDSLAAQLLAGTDAAAFSFWSPDGRFLVFFSRATASPFPPDESAPPQIYVQGFSKRTSSAIFRMVVVISMTA